MEQADAASVPARSEKHNAGVPQIADRFLLALGRIDANRADPTTIEIDGRLGPKELIHSQMVSAWVESYTSTRVRHCFSPLGRTISAAGRSPPLVPQAARDIYDGEQTSRRFHANEAVRILTECGYEGVVVSRVREIIRKHNLRNDPEVQALEDALCLVFIETQLKDVADQLQTKVLKNVLKKTWGKMSHKARTYALAMPLIEEIRSTLLSAVSST